LVRIGVHKLAVVMQMENPCWEIIEKLAITLFKETRCQNLCLAGGVALNCVANGRLQRAKIFRDMWIQPAPGDAGGAVGAAYLALHRLANTPRVPVDRMQGAFLGPEYSRDEIIAMLAKVGALHFLEAENEQELCDAVADELAAASASS